VGKFCYDARPEELDQSAGWGRGGRQWDASLWHSKEEMELIDQGWEMRNVCLW
jgi:alpha-D-ribose 1-methylphosphonate 5-phosphate C-P lyase